MIPKKIIFHIFFTSSLYRGFFQTKHIRKLDTHKHVPVYVAIQRHMGKYLKAGFSFWGSGFPFLKCDFGPLLLYN